MKNGFTLVELLGIIIILSLLTILILPVTNNIINDSKETVYQKQINDILNAAYDWSLKNISSLPKKNKKIYITLSDLKSEGLIGNVVDPNTKEQFLNNLVISINNVGGKYKFDNKNSKKSGDYLYTVEIEFMESHDYESNKPSIVLNNLTANSEGSYVTELNINDEFKESDFVATSKEGADLTPDVNVNIIYNNNIVSSVDTSKIGIYHIYYTVVDKDGYSNSVLRNVIVTDKIAPILTLEQSTTISSDTNSFDLMSGVSCTDNSGVCDITTNGTIKFGVKGKYVIEYIAKDSSGNTSTKKRVITIE